MNKNKKFRFADFDFDRDPNLRQEAGMGHKENTQSRTGGENMKRFCSLAVIGTLLMAGSAMAAKKSAFNVSAKATPDAQAVNEVVVPITIAYDANLTALDIPLKYSEGVTLTKVTFGDMLSGYDFKTANIDAENNTVIIGAINMVYGAKSDLAAGEGVVANLHFQVDDASVSTVKIEAITLKDPDHDLYFVYNEYDEQHVPHVVLETPEFQPVEVALSGGVDGSPLPTEFALEQNYPNPFNPTTKIPYDLKSATHVSVAVYNVLGQRVQTLVDEDQEAGSQVVEWNGKDANGNQVSSGMYFYKINAGNGLFVQTRKMVLLK